MLSSILDREGERRILWLPVPVGAGIACYFTLLFEPPLWWGLALCLTFAFMLVAGWRNGALRIALFGLLLAAAGFTAAQWRTEWVKTPVLPGKTEHVEISGRIVDVSVTPKGGKMVLDSVFIEDLEPEETPGRISIALRKYDDSLLTGQWVGMRAGLYPPPDPAYPGGFDFTRHFYFRGIGAMGYALPPVDLMDEGELGANDWRLWLSNLRHTLTGRFMGAMSEPNGAIAAAFITGDTRAIPEEINEAMRVSGLYHLLAVSGMNLVLVSGIIFFTVRLMIALIPALALRVNAKKWSAGAALIGSLLYLFLAGSPISAQRAYVMVALFLTAILLDRDASPMRSLMVAAFFILLVQPESLIHAGFQLSFAATVALIAFFEWCHHMWDKGRDEQTFFWRARFYIFSVFFTSLVAGLATAAFSIYHFQTFSTYGLLANMLVVPLVSFLMMPFALLALFVMPLNLEYYVLLPVDSGVRWMLEIANWVTGLPHATLHASPMPSWGIGVIALGGLWFLLWQTRWRWLGLPFIALGFATLYHPHYPDVLVNADRKYIAARLSDGRWALIKGRSGNMTVEQWQEYLGIEAFVKKPDEALLQRCEAGACVNLRTLAEALPETGDSVALYVEAGGVRMDTARMHQGDRPWVRVTPQK